MIRNMILAVAALAAVASITAAPAAAQQREFCVTRLPFPPVPPATQSKLVVYQAYAVPMVGQTNTVFSYHAQLQNQSSGTVILRVNTANLSNTNGGRWFSDRQTIRLTSYQPVDVIIAKLEVPGKSNVTPVEAWNVVDLLVRECPFSK